MATRGIEVGMSVLDADGRRLGKVDRLDAWGFEVRRGFWDARTWFIRYDELLEVGAEAVRVARSDATLFELAAGGMPHAWTPVHPAEAQAPLPATPPERYAASGAYPLRTPGVPDADRTH